MRHPLYLGFYFFGEGHLRFVRFGSAAAELFARAAVDGEMRSMRLRLVLLVLGTLLALLRSHAAASAAVDAHHVDTVSRIQQRILAAVGDDCAKPLFGAYTFVSFSVLRAHATAHTSPTVTANAYSDGSRSDYNHKNNNDDDDDSSDDRTEKLALGMSFAGVAVLIGIALLWRACWDCCKRSERHMKHRAFAKRTYVWLCIDLEVPRLLTLSRFV